MTGDLEVHRGHEIEVTQPRRGEWEIMLAQADVLARSNIVPQAYRRKPDDIVAAALFGRTVGFDVPTSLRLIHVVEGRPTFAADALVAMVRRAGHSLSGETSGTVAVARGRRADTGDEMTVEWTIEMARAANLAGKAVWKSYPQSMLWARAVSQLCRMLFADVTLGMAYTPEELDPHAEIDATGNVIDAVEVSAADVAKAVARREWDAVMAGRAASLHGEFADMWAAWKAAHKGWHLGDEGRSDAERALGELWAAQQAANETEPFGDVHEAVIVEAETLDAEAESAAPELGDAPAEQRQMRRLMALLKKAGVVDADRREWASGWLGRAVESFTTLTRAEVERLCEQAAAEADTEGAS